MAIIPIAHAAVAHFFAGDAVPNGAAITYGVTLSGTHPSPADDALTLHDLVDDHLMPLVASTLSLESTRVKWGPNATGPFGTFSGTVAGGSAPPNASPQTALLIEKQTALGGKSGRGRMYLPGLTEGAVENNGRVHTAAYGNFSSAVDAWLADIETAFGNMVILHNASSDPTIVTELNVDPVVATQRRRLRD